MGILCWKARIRCQRFPNAVHRLIEQGENRYSTQMTCWFFGKMASLNEQKQ